MKNPRLVSRALLTLQKWIARCLILAAGTCLVLPAFVPKLWAISPGESAPDFTAKNQDGKVIKLSDFKGKFVLIYFYPKDDTPGCTKEACSFRDEYSKIQKMNAAVLGVSRQNEKSHQEFRSKHKLPFDLLVDTDGALAKAFDVGTIPVIGFAKRESILIGPDGKVVQLYKDVDPTRHVRQVMGDIEKAQIHVNE